MSRGYFRDFSFPSLTEEEYMERFNNILRQQVEHLVGKTLSNSCEIEQSYRCGLVFCASLQCLPSLLTITIHDYRRFLDGLN